MTNIVKFAKWFSEEKYKTLFDEKIKELIELSDKKDKADYLELIAARICSEKCPCCGRICGLEKIHSHHKCVYGHQMRALNGSYFQRSNGRK